MSRAEGGEASKPTVPEFVTSASSLDQLLKVKPYVVGIDTLGGANSVDNKELLTDLHPVKPIELTGVGGRIEVNQAGYFAHGGVEVYYSPSMPTTVQWCVPRFLQRWHKISKYSPEEKWLLRIELENLPKELDGLPIETYCIAKMCKMGVILLTTLFPQQIYAERRRFMAVI